MKKHCIYLILLFLPITGIQSQIYQKTEKGLKTAINSVNIEIQFYTPSTVRVLKWPEGNTYTKESLSVIKGPQLVKFSIKDKDDQVVLKSEKLQVLLNLKTGIVSFETPGSGHLLKEQEGTCRFVDFDDAGSKTYSISQAFVLDKDEAIYGLGQQQQGKMVQRNLKLNMVQGNTDDYIPFFQSVKGYGLFWDNYSPTVFEDNQKAPHSNQMWAIASIIIS